MQQLLAMILVSVAIASIWVPRIIPIQSNQFLYSLGANDFLIYNYTRIYEGASSNGARACNSLIIVWVFSSNKTGVVYGVKSIGNGCCPYVDEHYSVMFLDLAGRVIRVVRGRPVPIEFLSPSDTSCVGNGIEYNGAIGSATLCYIGGVLDRAEIRYGLAGNGVLEVIKLVYSSNAFINFGIGKEAGKGLNLTRILLEAMPESHGIRLPYHIGDFVIYEVKFSRPSRCLVAERVQVAAVKGSLVAITTEAWPLSSCKRFIVANATRIVDVSKRPSELKEPLFFTSPKLNGNYTVDYSGKGIRIKGWQVYAKGVLVKALEEINEGNKTLIVTVTARNTSIPLVARCMAGCETHRSGGLLRGALAAILGATAALALALKDRRRAASTEY